MSEDFNYTDERFADIQMLRYRLKGFDELSAKQKALIYYLSEATLCGRDIPFDQYGKYNLLIRRTLEAVYETYSGRRDNVQFKALETYLKRVWFSNGIHHHYGSEKFVPAFSPDFLHDALRQTDPALLPVPDGGTVRSLCDLIFPILFDPGVLPKRVNKKDGEDLVKTSACNFYEGVDQREVEAFYAALKAQSDEEAPSFGLNSTLVKRDGRLEEVVWKADGRYGPAIRQIIKWLKKAEEVAENPQQKKVIGLLIDYYHTGDLCTFDCYSIEWLKAQDGLIDFINGFIEVYGDPLGLKGSWEGIVEYKDMDATRRTQTISGNAQWFEDHSPVDPRFRKHVVKGVTAHVVCAAMLGGEEYPSTAIGINLPNADWIRARYGSKSVTIGNLTEAYNQAARGNGFQEEFAIDEEVRTWIETYGSQCDDLHTDLHECLGHGSGQLLSGVDPDALKSYGSTIEEARADLFGLYFIADPKMVELGLLPNQEAYRAHYYTYMQNGMMTQLVRIQPGCQIEEAHMRNRALISRWAMDMDPVAVEMVDRDGKTYLQINDYEALRRVFATQLAEIQRIKSEGDYDAARRLVERYAVEVDPPLHKQVLARYQKLDIAPYKGFINPRLNPVFDGEGNVIDVLVDYHESYEHQMLRYSKSYSFL